MAQFKPGQSGNPAGRPRGTRTAALAKKARKHTEAALDALVAALGGKDRVAAARELLDRGWGKAAQLVEVTGRDGGPVEYADAGAEYRAIAERLAADAPDRDEGESPSGAQPH